MIRRGKHAAPRQTGRKTRLFGRAIPLALVASLIMGGVAFADTAYVSNTVSLDGPISDSDAVPGTQNSTGTAFVYLIAQNDVPDGDANGCNVDLGNPGTITLSSDNAGVTFPSGAGGTISDCGKDNAASVGYAISANACVANLGDVVTLSIASFSGGKPDTTSPQVRNYREDTTDILAITGLPVCSSGYTTNGFFQPVDMGNVLNKAKAGRTIPLKFDIIDGDENPVENDISFIELQKKFIACTAAGAGTYDIVETYATGGTELRWDDSAKQYIFNFATLSSWKDKCMVVTLYLDGDEAASAYFNFTK